MAEKFLLKDHLFNATTVGQLADEVARALPGFDAERFAQAALGGFADRELMARLEWIADCLEPHLAPDFPEMAAQLEAAMPPPLDPTRRDDDFGHFIHAVPGILAVRHGLEDHPARALDLLHAATQRFSMEFYIRPFINRWPEDTLARLALWAEDENYHVRRLVSEGTRPKLPWAKAVSLTQAQRMPLLDKLHADPARFVTRSVANHLNDISKTDPDLVLARLAHWADLAEQETKELAWMRRHALRGLLKEGHPGAMAALGYVRDLPLEVRLELDRDRVAIGDVLGIDVAISCARQAPVMIDYVLHSPRKSGGPGGRVYKMKTTTIKPGAPLQLHKAHRLKGDATTFRLYPGPARIALQINGQTVAEAPFELT